MGALHDPAAGLLAFGSLGRHLPFERNVQRVVTLGGQPGNARPDIRFIQAEMLLVATAGLGTWGGDAAKSFRGQRLVMGVGSADRDSNRDATSVSEYRALGAELSAIGRVFPGFFPRRGATWSSSHLSSATSKRYRGGGRTPSGRPSRDDRRCRAVPTLESSDAPCSNIQTREVTPSIGNLYGADKRSHRLHTADSLVGGHLCGLACTAATTVRSDAITIRGFAQTFRTNRNAYGPPCLTRKTSFSRSTPGVAICSVTG